MRNGMKGNVCSREEAFQKSLAYGYGEQIELTE
jgi:hypothetical protein